MLDEEHQDLPHLPNDSNLYTLGRIGEHNVVIACLPAGQIGNNAAAVVSTQMQSSFIRIRFGLMVGIGGGVPSAERDIRLGDIVVSQPDKGHSGVIQYDFGKTVPGRFDRTGFMNTPPAILLHALAKLRANHMRHKSNMLTHISAFALLPEFRRENTSPDILYEASYEHAGGPNCDNCNKDRQVKRAARNGCDINIHYGTIASGNQVIRDGTIRDQLSAQFGGVLCFEMEAAGLMNSFPCLIIRGISDYADSHKNKRWQAYAAATAAAYAKDLLSVIPASEVAIASTAQSIMETRWNSRLCWDSCSSLYSM
jgi:nucleoside phosphorylase